MTPKPRSWLDLSREALRPYYLRWLYFPLFPDRRPRHFGDCWDYPEATHPEAAPAEAAKQHQNGTGSDLLFLPMTDWHTRIQRTQHLARGFAAQGRRCFYLNPHLGREFPRPFPFSHSFRRIQLEAGVSELHVHLPREPVFHDRLLTLSETNQVVNDLSRLVGSCSISRMVQLVSFPVWSGVAEEMRRRMGFQIVYDCHDVLQGFRNIAPEIMAAETELLETCDLAVFSSEALLVDNVTRHPRLENRSILIRNAVDSEWVSMAGRHAQPEHRPAEIIVGYVGALDFWFDVDAIELAAQSHPDWQFILVGRVEDKKILKLEKLANIQFAGEVPHDRLHAYLSRFRVALIPFLRNQLTIGTNPIKLYEYFAYGLPVVSVRLPEMEGFGELVYLAEGTRDFLKCIEMAVNEEDIELQARRMQVANRENWGARVAQFNAALESL